MAKQTVDVGTSASDGTGDDLRVSFTKINENFTELYSGNVQVTAANIRVYSVAGRDGNVVLTVSDIAGGVSKAYVNAAIAANIANVSGVTYNSINANVAAANAVISNHSARITTLESNSAVQAVQINSLVSVKANVTYVDSSINNALGNSTVAANLSAINANITAANAAIIVLQANAGSQAVTLSTLVANAASQASDILTLVANAASQAATLTTLVANAVVQSLDIDSLQANAGSQSSTLNTLVSNAAGQSNDILALQANAGSQSSTLNTLVSNAATQSTAILSLNANVSAANVAIAVLQSNAANQTLEINSLWSNAGAQATTLSVLTANAATQSYSIDALTSNISTLFANATVQAGSLVSLAANAAVQSLDITTLYSNAAVQNLDINNLYSNAATQATSINSLTANAATQATSINVLIANAAVQSSDILVLQSNAGTQAVTINSIQANLGAYQTYANANIGVISTYSANIAGQVFVGNVQAPYLLANTNMYAGGVIMVGDPIPLAYPTLAGAFTGNVNGYYQLVVQNVNSGSQASGDIVITADDGSDTTNYFNIGINSSGWSGNFMVPAGDTGLVEYAHDGYLTVMGGNAAIRTDNGVFLVANTAVAGIFKDGAFFVTTEIESTGDIFYNNRQSSIRVLDSNIGNIVSVTIPVLDSNIGNIVSVTIPVLDSNIGNIVSVTIPVLDANIGTISLGNVGYTMANYQLWTSNVSTIASAIDQLVARIWAIENP